MSNELGNQIARIASNVSDALTAIGNKGVTVPSGSNSDDLATLIGQINTSGTTFVITLSYNDQTEMWEPDATFAEIQAAYNGGKEIVARCDPQDMLNATADGLYVADYTPPMYYYAVQEYSDQTVEVGIYQYGYIYTANGLTLDVTDFYPQPYLQNKEVSPTESNQIITYDEEDHFTGLASVRVTAIPSNYIGSGVSRKSSSDLTASGATVTAPAGYYSSSASKAVASGSVTMPASIDGGNTSISISSGKITLSKSVSATPSVTTAGYVSSGTAGNTTISLSATATSLGATTYTPTTSQQTIINAGTYIYGTQKIDAMPTGTAGTPTATKGTVSNHSVSITPSVTNTTGYITGSTKTGTAVSVTASELVSGTKSISANGTGIDVTNYAAVDVAVPSVDTTLIVTLSWNDQTDMWEPDRTFSEISAAYHGGKNIVVEPEYHGVASTDGEYIDEGGSDDAFIYYVTENTEDAYSRWYQRLTSYALTTDGLSLADTRSYYEPELENKTVNPTESQQTITYNPNAFYTGIGTVTVNAIPSNYVGSGITQRDSTDLIKNGAVVIAPKGYYENNATTTIASGSATPASSISATGATVSTGTNTLTLSKTVSNTPQVTMGYVSAGTAGNSSVSLTASVTTQAAQTIYPSTSDQTITGSKYLTGTQTIKGVAVSNTLTADNIKNGVTITIGDSADADRITSVTGTYSGGTSKNVQVVQGTTRTLSSSMRAIGAELTVSKTGTYDVYWSGLRTGTSASYTYATQLYIDGTAYGSENTTWTQHAQNNHLTNVSLTANQKLQVYGRESRNSTYYIYAPTLVIVEA